MSEKFPTQEVPRCPWDGVEAALPSGFCSKFCEKIFQNWEGLSGEEKERLVTLGNIDTMTKEQIKNAERERKEARQKLAGGLKEVLENEEEAA